MPNVAFHTQKHPDELRDAIVLAAQERKQSAVSIASELQAGSFDGWEGAYTIPVDTVRHYIRQAKNERLARSGSPSLEQGLGGAIYDLAGRLFTEAERQFDNAMKKDKHVELEVLDDLAKLLKTLEPLAKHKPVGDKPKPEEEGPGDPILRAAQEMNQ